ncbi:PrsW family intramembrane metalloprotease [candidate division KSB1 bacterium]|nr:PrsW family intramembrane metalloprotease [candidate division KSB1 bacterium]
MDYLILLALGFAPGIFWLWYIYQKDKFEPEPKNLIIKTFFYGILIAFPVVLIESGLYVSDLISLVVVAPIVEELAKYYVVKKTVYRSYSFNEPIDGVVYAAAAALGFAAIENAGYLWKGYSAGDGANSAIQSAAYIFFLRAFLSVPAHALFSSAWGFALGWSKFLPTANHSERTAIIRKGIIVAIFAHSVFNMLAQFNSILGIFTALGFLILMFYLWKKFNRRIELALLSSPFNPERAPVIASTPAEGISPADSDEFTDDEQEPIDDQA